MHVLGVEVFLPTHLLPLPSLTGVPLLNEHKTVDHRAAPAPFWPDQARDWRWGLRYRARGRKDLRRSRNPQPLGNDANHLEETFLKKTISEKYDDILNYIPRMFWRVANVSYTRALNQPLHKWYHWRKVFKGETDVEVEDPDGWRTYLHFLLQPNSSLSLSGEYAKTFYYKIYILLKLLIIITNWNKVLI